MWIRGIKMVKGYDWLPSHKRSIVGGEDGLFAVSEFVTILVKTRALTTGLITSPFVKADLALKGAGVDACLVECGNCPCYLSVCHIYRILIRRVMDTATTDL